MKLFRKSRKFIKNSYSCADLDDFPCKFRVFQLQIRESFVNSPKIYRQNRDFFEKFADFAFGSAWVQSKKIDKNPGILKELEFSQHFSAFVLRNQRFFAFFREKLSKLATISLLFCAFGCSNMKSSFAGEVFGLIFGDFFFGDSTFYQIIKKLLRNYREIIKKLSRFLKRILQVSSSSSQ